MEQKKVSIVHYIITAVIAFGFGALPPFGAMTEYGMGLLGTFIGAVYGWSTIGMIWPSFIALTAMGYYMGMAKMLAASIGNPVVAGLLIIFPMFAVLSELHVTEWLANKFITNKLSLGRPWVAIGMILLGAYFTSFINSILVIIIFGTFVCTLCKNLDIAPYSKFATAMMIGVAYAVMLGQIAVPMIGTGLTFSLAFQGMFQTAMPYAKFMAFMYPAGIALLLIYLAVMKFVLRVDVSPLKNLTLDMLGEDTGKLNADQKKAAGFFLIFTVVIMASSLVPADSAVGVFLGKFGFFGIGAIIAAIMMLVPMSDGRPCLDYVKSAGHIAWDPFWLTSYIMVVSTYLTGADTGLSATIAMVLQNFTSMSPWVFIIGVLIFAAVITNVANNLILTIVIMPLLFQFAGMVGMNGTGLVLVLFLTTQLALATPGASPITAIAMSNTSHVKVLDMMKMSFIVIPIMLFFSIVIGMAWSSIIF